MKDDEFISTSVKIKIKSVYGTINNGGAVKIYGFPCIDSNSDTLSKDEPKSTDLNIQYDLKNKVYKLDCKESLSNSDIFKDILLNDGDFLSVDC